MYQMYPEYTKNIPKKRMWRPLNPRSRRWRSWPHRGGEGLVFPFTKCFLLSRFRYIFSFLTRSYVGFWLEWARIRPLFLSAHLVWTQQHHAKYKIGRNLMASATSPGFSTSSRPSETCWHERPSASHLSPLDRFLQNRAVVNLPRSLPHWLAKSPSEHPPILGFASQKAPKNKTWFPKGLE